MTDFEHIRKPGARVGGRRITPLGRDRELHFFEQFLTDAEDGMGGLVVLQGLAGIGKSTLLGAVCEKAVARGFQVGHGLIEAGARARLPWPWPRILRDLAGEGCAALRRELVTAKAVGEGEDGYLGGSGLQAGRLALQLTDAIGLACEEAPVLIVLDDVQRMDAASVETLRLVAEAVEQLPVLILVAGLLEADAPEGTGADAMVAFAGSGSSHVLSLSGLGPAEIAEIVGPDLTVRFGGPALLHRLTAGNPMLAWELAQSSEKDATVLLEGRSLSEALSLLLHSRVVNYTAEVRGLLHAIGLETEAVDVGLLAEVLDFSLDDAEQWLGDLLSDGLVRTVSDDPRGPFLLTHNLLRDPVLRSMAPAQRRSLHQRYASALLRREAKGSVISTGAIADHCCMAVPLLEGELAGDWALRAAMEANQAAAWGAAEEWADRGIEALDRSEGSDSVSLRADLQIERFAALVGEGAPALASLRDCRQTFKKAGLERDWRAVTRVVDAERGRTMDAAILSEVLAMIEGCLASAEADGSSALLARKAALLHRISDPAARQECEDLSLEAMISAELPTADAEDRIHATAVFLLCNVFGRSPEERVRLGQGLLELLAEKADSNLLLVPSTTLVVDSLAGGDVAGADYAIGQISKQVALNAEHPTSWYPFHLNAMRCAMRGDAVGARRMLEAGLENTTAVTYLSAALCALVLQAHLCEIVGLPTAGGGPALPGLEFPEMPEGSTATTDLEVSEAAQAVQGAIRAPWSDQVVAIAAQLEGSRKVAELSAGGSVARVPVGAAPDMASHWQAGMLKVVLQVLGDRALAESMLEEWVGLKFSQIPRDAQWLSSLCLLSESVHSLRHERAAGQLFALLEPFKDRVAVASSAIVCSGAVAGYLAQLADVLGRREEALELCARAVEVNDSIGANYFAARIRLHGAQMCLREPSLDDFSQARKWVAEASRMIEDFKMEGLRPLLAEVQAAGREQGGLGVSADALSVSAQRSPVAAPPKAAFLSRGDFWEISWEGDTAQLRYQRGFDCLQILLSHPNQDLHCRELMTGAEAGAANPLDRASLQSGELGLADDDGLEIVDQQALVAYRARIEEAREELAEAESHHDLGRVQILREEIEAILAMVSGATGLGGRRRKTGSDVERARTAVRKRIKSALDRIRRDLPDLHAHLAANLNTGTICSYAPAVLPDWQTSSS
jgi:hypothetical protein